MRRAREQELLERAKRPRHVARFRDSYIVADDAHPELGTPCHVWIAGGQGYPTMPLGGPNILAHRVALAATGVDILGKQVHHKCRNIRCVNPDHLEALTPKEHKRAHRHDTTKPPRPRQVGTYPDLGEMNEHIRISMMWDDALSQPGSLDLMPAKKKDP